MTLGILQVLNIEYIEKTNEYKIKTKLYSGNRFGASSYFIDNKGMLSIDGINLYNEAAKETFKERPMAVFFIDIKNALGLSLIIAGKNILPNDNETYTDILVQYAMEYAEKTSDSKGDKYFDSIFLFSDDEVIWFSEQNKHSPYLVVPLEILNET